MANRYRHFIDEEEDYAKITSYIFESTTSATTPFQSSDVTKICKSPKSEEKLVAQPTKTPPEVAVVPATKTTATQNTNIKMSNSYREMEKQSLASSTIQTDQSLFVKYDQSTTQWSETAYNNNASEDFSSFTQLPITNLTPNTTIRIAPMEWNCGGWAEEHFHESLRLPSSSPVSRGILVKLQAKARECVTVALSPQPHFTIGKTYAIHIGAAHNLQTVIRRRLANQSEAVDVTIPTPHICSHQAYKSYWIVYQSNGQLSVGVGNTPGLHTIGTLDDSMYHALRSGVDAVRYVGLGNSALGRKARDLKVRNVQVMGIPDCFPNHQIPLKMYNPMDGLKDSTTMMDDNGDYTAAAAAAVADTGMDNNDDNPNDIYATLKRDAELWAEYQKECEKAQRRAKKFNIEYRQPNPDAFFKYSEARRLKANPERGFITGIDIMSNAEKEKAGKRKQRFEEEEKKNRELGIIGGDDVGDGGDGMEEDGGGNDGERKNDTNRRGPLPVEQAWDNIDLVEELRTDPPKHLHLTSPPSDNTQTPMDDDGNIDADELDVVEATQVPEKIHIFAIDWAAFKQIRTDDIMGYFSVYGPSYVEWLGELSCNVLFGDKYSAARAMEAMSRALPLSPPESLLGNPEENEGGEHINNDDDQAMEEDKVDESKDQAGSDTNIVADKAITEKIECSPSEGEEMKTDDNGIVTTENISFDAIETRNKNSTKMDTTENTNNKKTITNLGSMGWRMCNYPIRKRQDDRYGRRGTRARVLMRVANSLDALDERPTSWPKPPPGFTTRAVLGPGSDFRKRHYNNNKRGRNDDGRGGKRRRRHSNGAYESQNSHNNDGGDSRYD